jgi:hypothetical protein
LLIHRRNPLLSPQEVAETLDEMIAQHAHGQHRYKHIFVTGDQQFIDRMLVLINEQPTRYGMIIPCAGEFHFTAHGVHGVHRLYWNPLSNWAVQKLEFEKVVKKNDDNITHYDHYDHFYQLLTLAIFTVILEVVPPDLLDQPALLLDITRVNEGERAKAAFLKIFSVPDRLKVEKS